MIPPGRWCLIPTKRSRVRCAWSLRSLRSMDRLLQWSNTLPFTTCVSQIGSGSEREIGELVWEPLRCGRVLSLLHNPFYAGAYVYGRTKTRRHALPGEAPRIKGRTRQVKREDWPIVLLDAHPGSSSWDQFRSHQQTLVGNPHDRHHDRRAPTISLT